MARNWRMATICRAYRAGSVSRARGVLQVSSPLDHVQAGGRIEAERGPGKRGVALPLAEIDHALLAERVDELHLFQAARAEAQARGFERGAFAVARLQAEPFQAVGLAGLGDDVVAVQSLWIDQRRERARSEERRGGKKWSPRRETYGLNKKTENAEYEARQIRDSHHCVV